MSNAKIAPRPRARKSTTTTPPVLQAAPSAPLAPTKPPSVLDLALAGRTLPRRPSEPELAALRAYVDADPTLTEHELVALVLRMGDARKRPSTPLDPEARDEARRELALALDALPEALRAVARLSQAIEELGSPASPAIDPIDTLEAGREAIAEALAAIELATQATEEARALVDLGRSSHRRELGQLRAELAKTPWGGAARAQREVARRPVSATSAGGAS